MKAYIKNIIEVLQELNLTGLDPRHVYAYTQLQSTELSALTSQELQAELIVSANCANEALYIDNEILAKSFGL